MHTIIDESGDSKEFYGEWNYTFLYLYNMEREIKFHLVIIFFFITKNQGYPITSFITINSIKSI